MYFILSALLVLAIAYRVVLFPVLMIPYVSYPTSIVPLFNWRIAWNDIPWIICYGFRYM